MKDYNKMEKYCSYFSDEVDDIMKIKNQTKENTAKQM